MTNRELRERLDKVATLGRYAAEVELSGLRAIKSHSVSLMPDAVHHPYNCLAYALNIHEWPEYRQAEWKLSRSGHDQAAGSRLADALIEKGILSFEEDGELAFFYASGAWTHAAKVISPSRLQSKWGGGGLFDHGPLEVPWSYGTDLRRVKLVNAQGLIELAEAHLATVIYPG